MIKKYRFFTVSQNNGEMFDGKPVYRIYNNNTKTELGRISYYAPWKQFVFSMAPRAVFNDRCLRHVLDFMKTIRKTIR